MQAKLITFGTVFASWGAAAFSGQSESSTYTPLLCLFGHIYVPLFQSCLRALHAIHGTP